MLKHLNEHCIKPKRVVILGGNGFVGSAAVKRLQEDNINLISIGREEIDLCAANATQQLVKILRSDDALLVIAAKAPCKNHGMLLQNIQIMNAVCGALIIQNVQHLIYISSDAVYTDSMMKLNEGSPAAPTSLHGAMHLAREKMLASVVSEQELAILRPSLLYGANDPHNGYGPNSFYRLAQAAKSIELFGKGEELRDHVYIEDVAELIYLALVHRSYGVLNITTGEVASFAQIAALLSQYLPNSVNIKFRARSGPMPHNGYRAFDNSVCQQAFAAFEYTQLSVGLQKMHELHLQKLTGEVNARN